MRVAVITKAGYYEIPDGWIPAEFELGDLVSVMWHPIDGPTGAVLMDNGDFEYHKMDKVEPFDQ